MANMDSFGDLLHCMICFESYSNPKMLKCAHTFCEQCLQGYYSTYQQQKRAVLGKLPCPSCREQTTLPASGVAGLRNDFKVRKLEDMFRTMNMKQRAASHLCDSCGAQNKTIPATGYCAGCSMNYCGSCLKKHNKNTLFAKHQIVSKKEDSSDFFCKVHAGEQGRFFCVNCEVIVCTLCVMLAHEGHTVEEVDSVFRRHRHDIKNLRGMVQTKLAGLEERSRQLQATRQLCLSSCQTAELDIKERTDQVIGAIKEKRKEILTELRQRRTRHLAEIQEEMDDVNNRLAQTQGAQDFADTSVQRNSLRMIAVHEELIQRMRTVLDLAEASSSNSSVFRVVTFLPGHQVPDLGRVDDVEGNPELLQRHLPSESSPQVNRRLSSRPSTSSISQNPNSATPTLVLHVHKYGAGRGELRDPLGVTCLLNGDIVVSEWGNKRVQVFDTTGQTVGEIGTGIIGPQGVAVTLRGNIIVTDGRHKRIQVFTPTGKSLSIWGLGRFYAPCGISTSPNGNFVVSDSAEHAVSVYRGEKACIVRFGSRGAADEHFHNPLYVTTNQRNDIIVSDSDNHCIKIFNSKGAFLRKFGSEGSKDGQLKFPRGVATDYQGNIMVADRNNHRVSLFSSHGRFVRHLLTANDGMKDPYALTLSVTGNLVVTESAQDRAAIKMFQF